MTTLFLDEESYSDSSPLDLVEELVASREWTYERYGDDELTAAVSSSWNELHLRYLWREDSGLLQIAAVYDLRVPASKKAKIHETLALINERLWLGHFEMWAEEGAIMFRHALLVPDDMIGVAAQCEAVSFAAVKECERFFPVLQFVIWADKDPEEAVEAAMLETMGEA